MRRRNLAALTLAALVPLSAVGISQAEMTATPGKPFTVATGTCDERFEVARPLREVVSAHAAAAATAATLNRDGTAAAAAAAASDDAASTIATAGGLTAADVRALVTDPSVHVVGDCKLAYAEPASLAPPHPTDIAQQRSSASAKQAAAAQLPAPTVKKVFNLSSKKAAPLTIYLDFDGANLKHTAHYDKRRPATATAGRFNLDNNDKAYSEAERRAMFEIWQTVSATYAAWHVNVTTVKPTFDDLKRSGPNDRRYGTTIVVTGSHPGGAACSCTGWAFIGTFDTTWTNQMEYRTGLVFAQRMRAYMADHADLVGKVIGSVASHEVGHQLGLKHDGGKDSEYHQGNEVWGPIMGSAYKAPLMQFDKGAYAGATNRQQNDLVIISRQLPRAGDQHPGKPSAAVEIPLNKAQYPMLGIGDGDAFKVNLTKGQRVRIGAVPAARFSPLDLQMQVYDRTGKVLATRNPGTSAKDRNTAVGVGAWHDFTATYTGKYTVRIAAGVSVSTSGTRYTGQYGNYGRYRLRVSTS